RAGCTEGDRRIDRVRDGERAIVERELEPCVLAVTCDRPAGTRRGDLAAAGIEDRHRVDPESREPAPGEEADEPLGRHAWLKLGVETPPPGPLPLMMRDGQELFGGVAADHDGLVPRASRTAGAVLVALPGVARDGGSERHSVPVARHAVA